MGRPPGSKNKRPSQQMGPSRTVRLRLSTIERIDKRGVYKHTYDDVITKVLDKLEAIERDIQASEMGPE